MEDARPFATLEEEEVAGEVAPALASFAASPAAAENLGLPQPWSAPRPAQAGSTSGEMDIGSDLAYRALRDSVGLQLARRGFDGLRQNALNLLTELTSEYIRAVGMQLEQAAAAADDDCAAPPASLELVVARASQLANVRSAYDWRLLQESFSRQFEPLQGSLANTLKAQRQLSVGGPLPPQVRAPTSAPCRLAARSPRNRSIAPALCCATTAMRAM